MRLGFFVCAIAAVCLLSSPLMGYAQDANITQGMSQGEFARALLKAVGAQSLLPPAATLNDIFRFFENLGLIPPGGWKSDSEITKEDLAAMLGLTLEQAKELSFEELVDQLQTKLVTIVNTIITGSAGSSSASASPIAPVP